MFSKIRKPAPNKVQNATTATISIPYPAIVDSANENPVTFRLTLDPTTEIYVLKEDGQPAKEITWTEDIGTAIQIYKKDFKIKASESRSLPQAGLITLNARNAQGAGAIPSTTFIIVIE